LKLKVTSVQNVLIRTASTVFLAATTLIATAASPRVDGPVGAVTNHVIIISIDGLRPDAIEAFEARTMQRLMREGAYTLTAETVYPSRTLPSHTSMLTGVPPAVHGITWNTDQTGARGVMEQATIFELAKGQGFTTAAFFSKAKLRHLERPGTLDHAQAPRGLSVYPATLTVEDATRYMQFRRPNLLFVHIAEPDAAGHRFGWMGSAYRAAVRRADAAVAGIIAAADASYGAGGYTVIVTADHGGNGHDHGSDHDEDMQIPWIAWGAGVQPGELTLAVNTMDTAATALWLLGIAEPAVWHGVAVAAAYTPAARQLASAARTPPPIAPAP
jgi:predicted AlkP superfamily pyrophosphatase or phosphodiesterase